MVVTIETLVEEKKFKSTQTITALGCEYCQESYKKMWLFDGLLYLQIEHADGLHYLTVVPNGDSEDVGFLYNLCASQEIHFCPMCGERFEEEY